LVASKSNPHPSLLCQIVQLPENYEREDGMGVSHCLRGMSAPSLEEIVAEILTMVVRNDLNILVVVEDPGDVEVVGDGGCF
jgi:hypothetical protein